MVTAGSKDNEVCSMEVTPGEITKKEIIYTGEATTIYVYSASSGINLYLLSVKENGTPSGIVSAEAGKEVVATEYYNVVGMRLNEPAKGLNIIKRIMSDGSVETTKACIE